LALFYVGGIAVLVGVMPWNQVGLAESPFVRVFQTVGIPAAAAVMNFVVLTAALSSVNCNLYLTTRMIFSLARGGYAPAALGKLSRHGTPVHALLVSSAGMFAALLLEHFLQQSTYLYMLGAAFFGGLFVWMMIFVTHLAFRRRRAQDMASPGAASGARRSPGPEVSRGKSDAPEQPAPLRFAPPGPWTSLGGLAALTAVGISTWWIPGMRITLVAGLPWLAFISLCYLAWARLRRPARTISL